MRKSSGAPGEGWTRWVCLAGIAAGIASVSYRKLADPDLPWHLAVGRAVVAGKSLLSGDSFSYTFPGKPVPYEYLSDVSLYLSYRLSHDFGPVLLIALTIGLLLVLMRARAARDSGPAGWFVLAAALTALGPWLLLRPATLGFPVFAAELLLIERHRRGGKARELWALVPLQILYANVHAFAVLGSGLIVFYACSRGACALARGARNPLLPAADGKDAGLVAAIALASVAATCLSSFGPAIFLGPFRVAGHERYIAEWTPASWNLLVHGDPALLLVMLSTAAAFIWGKDEGGRRVPSLYILGLVVGTFAAALLRFRLSPIFLIATAPLLAERLQPLVRGWRTAPFVAALMGAIVPFGLGATSPAPHGTGFDPGWTPVAAGDYIEANAPRGPVWNNLAFGGYLIWRFSPNIPVFLDGRTAYLYPNEFLEDAFKAEVSPEAFAALSAKYGFEWALTDARGLEPFGSTLASNPGWTMTYVDDRAAVYVRNAGPNAALARSGYRVLKHLTPWQELLASPPSLDALTSDVSRALAQSPQSVHVHLWAAALALLKKDRNGFVDQRRILAERIPGDPALAGLDEASRR
jgi:hypothetical protein